LYQQQPWSILSLRWQIEPNYIEPNHNRLAGRAAGAQQNDINYKNGAEQQRNGTNDMKIPKALIAAIQTYYYNRSRQYNIKWDKQADLNAISKIVLRHGLAFEASAGTFWIKYRTRSRNWRTLYVNEDMFPNFQLLADGQCFPDNK